jgi:arabinan endo-1,5-alpha-L-arabinosidase
VAGARKRGVPRRRRVARERFRITESEPAPGAATSPPASPSTGPSLPSSRPRPATYTNPVFGESAPDPMVLGAGNGDYYEYSTGSLFPVLHSRDLVHWTRKGTALAARPSWVVPTGDSNPWAPSVLRSSQACPGAGSGPCYFLYYVGLSGQHSPDTHCVGVAFSTGPAGPFQDRGPLPDQSGGLDSSGRPPGCGDNAGYSNIDPAPFVDLDGKVYLYLTTNRRCSTEPPGQACPYLPAISAIPLAADLMHATGARKPLLDGAAGSWEQQGGAPTVENPWVERHNGRYFLFYSGGNYKAAYGMGYATASSPMGDPGPTPFIKSSSNPILKERAGVLSPGGGSVVRGPHGGDWLVYHGRAGDYTQPRTLRIDPVVWGSGGTVSINGPTSTPQKPVP